jgi:transcription-repair coupling factor (superfamily II helicase)
VSLLHASELLVSGRALAGLPEGAAGFLLSRTPGQLLVVVPDEAEAERVVAELDFYGRRAMLYPVDDCRPYEGLSPHPDLPRERIEALDALDRGEAVAVVLPAQALLPRVLPAQALADAPVLNVGDEVEPRALAQRLGDLGYLPVAQVQDPGTFSLRGDVLDLWPTGLQQPLRVEFFDEEIEALRLLDASGLRPGDSLRSKRILPSREDLLGEAPLARASSLLYERAEGLGYRVRLRREVLDDLRAGIRFSGCDAWLPALHPLGSLLDRVRGRRVVLDRPGVEAALRKRHERIQTRFAALPEHERPLVHPEERYLSAEAAAQGLSEAVTISELAVDEALDLGCRDNRGLAVGQGDLAPTVGKLGAWLDQDWRVAVVVDTSTRAERLRQLFAPHGLQLLDHRDHDPLSWPTGQLVLLRGDLPRGFHDPASELAVVTAGEILGEKRKVRHGRARLAREEQAIGGFSELREGDLVVHERHGIGRYQGLARVDLGRGPQDMVLLEYRGGDRMYLPVIRLDRLYRYRASNSAAEPKLDKLGGESWKLRKARVKDAVLKLAHELLKLQAERQVHPGTAYPARTNAMRRFEDAFPYTETRDQAQAIEEVVADLARPEPMDRLIVGDAGFGKTEVAMRAAFAVCEAGRQVALLCPTTVLAFQHLQTFRERFAGTGVRVELLSRFTDRKDAVAIRKGLKEGAVDIVIGTTQLLGRALRYKDLGLVVVDEEHRFGVKQKERFKRIRAEVDYLALSATPIPRSLHMAMSGIRGISVISTPPMDRLPVGTLVARFGQGRIREEILRELKRGGQVFFVHNRIASIEVMARTIREAVPEASVEVAHGQMDDGALEDVLVRYVNRKFDVLVCTAIIESGIDMPNVNTILVNRADRFGLAQLYQLRGRVGRSHRRGYCTLLIDEGRDLTRKAMQRLRVLQEHTRLGSGMAVATADLELRGAGNLLGDRQHGNIEAVGFEAYMSLLDEAMEEARGLVSRERIDPEIEVPRPAWLPEEYVPDLSERLSLYKSLSSARDLPQLRRILDGLEAERGELPVEVLNLMRLLELKLRARELGILRIHVLQVRVVMELSEHSAVTPERVVELARKMPRRMRVGETRVEFRFTPEEAKQPFLFVHWALDRLSEPG